MNDIIDKTTSWMIADRPYPCDSAYQMNNKTPVAAMKTDNGDAGPTLSITFSDGSTALLKRNVSSSVIGEIGIILTPFYDANEYPSCIAFHQGRLCLGGSKKDPNVLYMSKVNDYSNFAVFEEVEYIQTALKPTAEWSDQNIPEYETNVNINQQIGASSSIVLQIATDENEAIQNLVAQDDLFVGSATSEWIFPSGSTALNARVVIVSRHGSAPIQPKFVENSILYLNPSATRMWSFGPQAQDLLRYAEHIARSSIVSFDFRQDPTTEIYAVLADGTALVGRITDSGMSWARIRTSTGASIESVACIRASDEDAVYFVMRRPFGASYYRSIERLKTVDTETFGGRFHLDCATYSATSGSIITVTRFADMTVSVRFLMADGTESAGTAALNSVGTATQYTPDGGAVAIAIPSFSEVIVGLPFTSRVETFRMDSVDTEGLSKKADAVHFRLYNTGRFLLVRDAVGAFHPREEYLVTMPTLDGVEQYPYSGPIKYENVGPWDVDQTVIMESNSSASWGILTIAPQYEVGDTL